MAKIIVIEDDPYTLNEVVGWLQLEGYEVIGALDGQLGLDAIRHDPPDLIICDIAMPEANGHEVLIEVRSDPKLNHIPFVFLTVSDDRASVRKGMNLGADDYLTKPVTRAEVYNVVKSRLNKQAVQDARSKSLVASFNQAFSEEHEQRLVKSRIIAIFSHDFRNPLTSILMSSSMIRNYEDRLSPERKTQHLDNIEGAAHLLVQMLDDMMMVAELEGGQLEYMPQLMNLSQFVEAIIREFQLIDQDSHQLTFHTALKYELQADPKLLRHILVNLISNARRYTPFGGKISVNLYEDDKHIHLSVEDDGMGIPEDSLSRLFEPFYRASNVKDIKGTGLGLSIVKECVERHCGNITVNSEVGKGTIFKVELPLIII